ncbi:hypothetical protein ACMD2_19905 [Ananas comosus]|uniref:Reverse transcriptase domain-containing protein n=1 Tax=Ananas comosus TaxID=4615 RepID=A0A199VY35_ANACO|nr:hypothetical protein ACMD2_19905 [Ananas comosus]
MVTECLARMTEEAVRNNMLRGIGPSDANWITLIQYVDDTIFFCKAKKRSIRDLKLLWNLFEWAFGLKINKEKPELFYTGRRENKAFRLTNILSCKVEDFPIKAAAPLRLLLLYKAPIAKKTTNQKANPPPGYPFTDPSSNVKSQPTKRKQDMQSKPYPKQEEEIDEIDEIEESNFMVETFIM